MQKYIAQCVRGGKTMTDEENAKKYAKEISRCRECINYNYCHKIENEYHPKCKKWEWLLIGLKKGLAEGKPKWHDLREDPNDLPKETGYYLTDDGEYFYDVDCRKWRTVTCRVCWDFMWLYVS